MDTEKDANNSHTEWTFPEYSGTWEGPYRDYKPADFAADPVNAIKPPPPEIRHFISAIGWAGLCTIISLLYWHSPVGYLLAGSKESIFYQGELWRLVTTLFVHSDIGHILSNSFLLVPFAFFLRNDFGLRAFPVSSIAIGILTTIATLWNMPDRIQLIGASGMLYGMIGLWLSCWGRSAKQYTRKDKWMRSIAFVLVVLIPSQYQENVSYAAHAWGFVIGVVWGIFLPINHRQKANINYS